MRNKVPKLAGSGNVGISNVSNSYARSVGSAGTNVVYSRQGAGRLGPTGTPYPIQITVISGAGGSKSTRQRIFARPYWWWVLILETQKLQSAA